MRQLTCPRAGEAGPRRGSLQWKTKNPGLDTRDDGADNGTRTRALDLGKVALYQLSYVRKRLTRIFYFTQCNFIKQYKAQIENFKACGIF